MPVRIAQISDIHLDPGRPTADDNLAIIRDSLAELGPDVVVVTGDLTDDGWKSPALLTEAMKALKNLARAIGDVPVHVVPGNHDVGNFAGFGKEEITADQVDAYRATVGDDRFDVCFENWRLVGINSMLLGSCLTAEEEQYAWLEQTFEVAQQQGQYILLCSHAPLYITDPAEAEGGVHGYWVPKPGPRDRVLKMVSQYEIRCTISGHVHQGLVEASRAWCPPASGVFVRTDDFPQAPGWDEPGYLVHELGDNAMVSTTRQPLTLQTNLYEIA